MSKDAKKISANRWLSLLWASGAAIYGWLLVGAIHKHQHEDVIWEVPPYTGLSLGGLLFGAVFLISCSVLKDGKTSPAEEAQNQGALTPIIVTLFPALFFVSALATLVLTLATYNGDWVDARQGLATAFASLIAAVGVVVSVAVSYKSGEENRLAQEKNLVTQLKAQQDNLKTQLEHQREIEDEKGRREERKQDAELIKTLNDRLHEIIPRRYGDKPSEVSASYFQLAALYRDWETLAASSNLVEGQKDIQQRNILKILFGIYQEDSSGRSEVGINSLDSIVSDLFPVRNIVMPSSAGKVKKFDLRNLDLRFLNMSLKNLRGTFFDYSNMANANFFKSDLSGSHFVGADLENVNLSRARMNGSNLSDVNLRGADLRGASIEGTYIRDSIFCGANLSFARLRGVDILRVDFEDACLCNVHFDDSNFFDVNLKNAHFSSPDDFLNSDDCRGELIERMKVSRVLPRKEELLKAKGLSEDFIDELFRAHKEYWAEK